jgi:hypothetical protein
LLVFSLAATGCDKGEPVAAHYGQGQAASPASPANKGPSPAPLQTAKLINADGTPSKPAATSQPTSQPMAHGGGLPPGHPPAGGMPPGHPPAGELPPGHPPAGGLPPGHPPTEAPPLGDPIGDGTVQGTIELGSGLEAKIKPGSVLFIIVRRDAGEGAKGMLIASQKLPVGPGMFPLRYTITRKDVMMQGTQLAGPVRVDARIDGDGDALSKDPGDIVGAAKGAVSVGTHGVDFTLDQVL